MAQISFHGNVANAELVTLGGTEALKFSVAEKHRSKNKQSGQYEDSGTTWHRVTFWGNNLFTPQALFNQISGKGSMVLVTGEQTSRTYTKDGEERSAMDIRPDYVGVLAKEGQGGGGQRSGSFGGQQSYGQQATQQPTWGQGNQGTNTQSWGTQDDDVAPF